MKKRIIGLVAILTVVLSLVPSTVGADSLNKYTIEAKLNYERAFLEVKETVAFTNRTPRPLTSIVFNVTPAHFRAFSLKASLVDGASVEPKVDGVVLELPLPKPLEPRASTQVQLEFTLDVPQQGGRFGINQRVLALGNWYPVLAVYRDGWDRHRYNTFGDPFFTEMGDYEVVLNVSADVKVGHSGELLGREGNLWRMKGSKIRDFALAISDRYETRTLDVNGTTITALYLPEHRPAGLLYLDATARGLKWLGDKLGAYPHKQLYVVETVSTSSEMVGQEYPGIVFISSSLADKAGGMTSYLAYLVAHEVVHQWFYAMVGNDQMNDGWMDEALATYLGYQVLDWAPLTLGSPSVVAAGNSPVNVTIYDFSDEGRYAATVYGKGAVFLQDLNAAMKSENFYKMLRRYVELYQDKIATPRDFLSLAQSFSTTNLNALIRKYFSYPEYKGDSTLKLDVKWPTEDTWTGKASLNFEIDSPSRQVSVDADGRVLLSQEAPTSPLTIDVSQLEDDEYVVRLTVKDESGRTAQQMHRVKVTNPRPVPTKTAPVTQNNNVAFEIAGQVGNITQTVSTVDMTSYLLFGGGLLAGLITLVIVVVAIKYVTRPTIRLEYLPKPPKNRAAQPKPPDVRPLAQVAQAAPPSAPMANVGPIRYDRDKYGKYGIGELEELEAGESDDRIIPSAGPDRGASSPTDKEGGAKGNPLPFPNDFQPQDS